MIVFIIGETDNFRKNGSYLGGHEDGEAARAAHTAAGAGRAGWRGHARGCNNVRLSEVRGGGQWSEDSHTELSWAGSELAAE